MGIWKECTIADLGKIITGKTPSTKNNEYWNGSVMFVTPKDIHSTKHILHTERYISEQGKIKMSGCILPENAVCVSCIGNIGYLGITTQECISNQQINSIVVNENNDTDYVYYLLKSFWSYFKHCEFQSTAVSILNKTQFSNIKVKIPTIKVQKRIASVLSALDDKIELNNRINKNLEEQAQAIFVDYMNNNRYNLIPLDKIADIIDCLHSKKPVSVTESNYQLIQLNNIRDDGFLDMTACRYMISKKDYENWTRKCEITEGDCLITNVGRIGAVCQAPAGTKATMGRNMTCIRLKNKFNLSAYLITALLSKHMKTQIILNTDEGTIMDALNVKNIPKLLFPFYTSEIMKNLEKILLPIRKQIENNNLQNQCLSAIRDSLLPKLINGEIDVSKVRI